MAYSEHLLGLRLVEPRPFNVDLQFANVDKGEYAVRTRYNRDSWSAAAAVRKTCA